MKNVVYGNKEGLVLIIGFILLFPLALIATIYQGTYFIILVIISLFFLLFGIRNLRFKITFEKDFLLLRLLKLRRINYEEIERFKIRRKEVKNKHSQGILYFCIIILKNNKTIKLPAIRPIEGNKLTKILKQKRIKTKS